MIRVTEWKNIIIKSPPKGYSSTHIYEPIGMKLQCIWSSMYLNLLNQTFSSQNGFHHWKTNILVIQSISFIKFLFWFPPSWNSCMNGCNLDYEINEYYCQWTHVIKPVCFVVVAVFLKINQTSNERELFLKRFLWKMVTQSSNVFFVVEPFIRLDFANVTLNTSFLYASSILKSSGKKY